MREANYIEKPIIEWQYDTAEVAEISHEKLLPMPEKYTFMFHNYFYLKPKIYLEDAKISQETQNKLFTLKQEHDDVVRKYSSDIGLTHLEEMKMETDPKLPPVVSKPYLLLLKNHKFVSTQWVPMLKQSLQFQEKVIKRFLWLKQNDWL